jgi:hypothetical protein
MERPMHPGAEASASRMTTTVAGPPWRLVTPAAVVEFDWRGDRWAHRVILPARADRSAGAEPVCGSASIEWASIEWASIEWASVEGPLPPEDDPRWPASPALVNVTSVLAAAGPALVGVGLSGRSHFSATVAADPAAPGAIRFEIACRLHEAAGWLGSTYRSGGRLVRIAATPPPARLPHTVTWAYSLGPEGPFAAVGATIHDATAGQPPDHERAG